MLLSLKFVLFCPTDVSFLVVIIVCFSFLNNSFFIGLLFVHNFSFDFLFLLANTVAAFLDSGCSVLGLSIVRGR